MADRFFLASLFHGVCWADRVGFSRLPSTFQALALADKLKIRAFGWHFYSGIGGRLFFFADEDPRRRSFGEEWILFSGMKSFRFEGQKCEEWKCVKTKDGHFFRVVDLLFSPFKANSFPRLFAQQTSSSLSIQLYHYISEKKFLVSNYYSFNFFIFVGKFAGKIDQNSLYFLPYLDFFSFFLFSLVNLMAK